MLTKGMTAEQVDEMTALRGWETLEDTTFTAWDGSTTRVLTVRKGNRIVTVTIARGVVTILQENPAWM